MMRFLKERWATSAGWLDDRLSACGRAGQTTLRWFRPGIDLWPWLVADAGLVVYLTFSSQGSSAVSEFALYPPELWVIAFGVGAAFVLTFAACLITSLVLAIHREVTVRGPTRVWRDGRPAGRLVIGWRRTWQDALGRAMAADGSGKRPGRRRVFRRPLVDGLGPHAEKRVARTPFVARASRSFARLPLCTGSARFWPNGDGARARSCAGHHGALICLSRWGRCSFHCWD